MTRAVVLRNGVELQDAAGVVTAFLDAYGSWDGGAETPPGTFGEPDLRHANRGGARIAAAEIAAVLERRRAIERALRAIPPDASLIDSAPPALGRLFAGFGGIRGVGFAKMTKALHPKRPALIPLLDSLVQRHLRDDDPGAAAPFEERALALVRGYKRDLDRNRAALAQLRRDLGRRGYPATEVRILDVLIWSAEADALVH